MRSLDDNILGGAQAFAARWGFINRNLFFKFLCPKQRTQQFRYWNCLLENGLFVKSKSNPNVLFLSHRSRRQLGQSARPSRFHLLVEHDAIVAEVALTLDQYALVGRYWLEDDLMRNPLAAYQVLGGNTICRVPDFIFDLKSRKAGLRCAVEIEKTPKTQSRYDKMALAYTDYRQINLILFGCINSATEALIRRSFSAQSLKDRGIVPGTFLYSEFREHGLTTRLRFNEKVLTFQNMLEGLTGGPVHDRNSKADVKRMDVRFTNPKLEEAA